MTLDRGRFDLRCEMAQLIFFNCGKGRCFGVAAIVHEDCYVSTIGNPSMCC